MSRRSAPDVERFGRLAAILLVAAGAILRVRGLSEYWLNADEGIYYSTLTRASADAFWAEVAANAHPPAFYLLLRWLGFLTWDFVWLRGASVVFGVAAIWVFWLIGRELGGSGPRGVTAGVVAAAFLALNPEAVILSQVLRPYMLVVLLLGGALLALLRYRRAPDVRNLFGYATFLGVAVLTHYSAALAIGVFSLVLLHDALTRHLPGSALQGLLAAHAVPTLLLAGLYVVHLGAALESELMGEALDPGGWLSAWLIDGPGAAWDSLVAYQAFHLPPSFRVRALVLLSAAVAVSALGRDRTVAVLAAGAITIAIAVSALGVYPFGPSRHNAWLVVFTIPALGWLAGVLVTSSRPRALLGAGALLVAFVAGIPLEGVLGGAEARSGPIRTNATEEQVLRRADLAPLIVERMAPDAEPRIILMTEQSYNVLMPLYASERELVTPSRESSAFYFDYGTRKVVVARRWDWTGGQDVARLLAAFPELLADDPSTVLVVAGGWGSNLFARVPELERIGAVVDRTWALGRDPAGRTVGRMMALVVDPSALPSPAAR